MKSFFVVKRRSILSVVSTLALFQTALQLETARAQFITISNTAAVTITTNIPVPSDGGTYVLEKFSPGQLTLGGQITGGATSILRTTTQTSGDSTTIFEFAATNSAFSGTVETFRGAVEVDNPLSLGTGPVQGDGNFGTAGDLLFNASMTFTNPLVMISPTSISSGPNNVIMSGPISGNFLLSKYGSGRLTLSGANTYADTTTNAAGTLALGTTTWASGDVLVTLAGAATESSGTLNLDANASAQLNGASGSGVLRLTATGNSAASPDIYFNANNVANANSTANDGTEISSTLDLGTTQRYIYGLTDHNGVGRYAASSGTDCTFAGAITNTGGLTFIAQDSYTGSNPMECPFYLTGVNTFTGPVEIQRGSLYLGNASALISTNVLRFNTVSGNNARFFLYGNNAVVADLQSTGAGNALIVNGNLNPGNVGPASLTVIQNNPFTYSGNINDLQSEYNATTGLTKVPTFSLVKKGVAALTLAGTCAYSGTTTIDAGKLYFNANSTGAGAVYVANGATLGGIATISSTVTVTNGGTLEAGNGTGVGTLTLKTVALGAATADALTINCGSTLSGGLTGNLTVSTSNGLTNNGITTINVTGNLRSTVPATYTLVSYSGAIKGTGSFVLGSLPDSAVAYLTNNTTASALQLVVSSVTIPSITWVGAPLSNWDLLGSNVWRQTGSTTPANYTNGSLVVFDDSASSFAVNVAATVSPASLIISNINNNYVFSGSGAISGLGLTKTGSGKLTLNTANNYTGSTTISAGKVVLGNVAAIPNTGSVVVNGTLDVGGFSPTYNTFSGSGVVDNATAGGTPVITVSSTANTAFSGTMQNTTGALGLNVIGTGTFTLRGANTFSGGTSIGNFNASAGGGTLAVGVNNALPVASPLTIDNRSGSSVLSLGTFNQNIGALTFYAGAAARTIISGTGTLALSSTLTLVDPHVPSGGQDYPLTISAPIDLHGATSTFMVGYGNNAESSDLGDFHINGVIMNSTGTAGLILTNWYNSGTSYHGSVTLGAANTYNGPTFLAGGAGVDDHGYANTSTVALLVNNALPNNSAFIQSPNTILDLTAWGDTTGVTSGIGSLTGAGSIILGSAGRLTIGYDNTSPAAYSGTISGVGGGITKTGTGTLILTGTNTYTGSTPVLNGTLIINGGSTGGGAVTVANGAVLGGSGTIASAITITNGAALQTDAGTGIGTLTVNSLSLGFAAPDATTLNFSANPAGINGVSVSNANGFTNNSTATINITGTLSASTPAIYPLISYVGTSHGTGTFVLGSLPDSAVAYITNNISASAIQLVVTSVTIPTVTWVGSPANDWDLSGASIWKITGIGTATSYADGDVTIFDDTATNFQVNVAALVSPNSVVVTNSANNYVLGGTGNIGGYGLIKQGSATLTLATSNSYAGNTTISAGTLVMGVAGSIPGGSGYGNITVNGTLDVNGLSPTLNNLSGSGVVDDISAGGSPVLNVMNSTGTTFSGAIQNTSGSLELDLLAGGTLSLTGTNNYSGVTTITGGTLQVGSGGTSGTLGSGAVLDMGTLAFNRSDSNGVPNNIAGTGGITQNGPGMLDLTGNLTYSGPTVVNAGTLILPNDVTFDAGAGATLTVATNAVMESGFVLSLNANPSSVAVDVAGAGTVRLISTIDRIESFPDLTVGANNNGVSTANFGVRLASQLDVGSVQRLVWALSSEDDVARFGLSGCDFQFAGPILGTAQLSLLGKNSWSGVNTMEEQFALTAANTGFTGPLEVLRGSVYLGNPNALTAGNVLILDPAASVNSRLFLYGYNASVSDLQSGGFGSTVIADGNNVSSTNVGPATLTVTENNPTTFAGNIVDWYTEFVAPPTGTLIPTLSLVKNGSAALILTGVNTYSGTTVINTGKLYLNGSSTGGGAITVNAGATLGGNGLINSAVTVKNGGTIETGDGTGNGTTQVKSVALGATTGDQVVLNVTPNAILNITNNNGLVLNGGTGSVTVNVGGTIASLGAVPLITYKGTLAGTGYGAFQLGSMPAGVVGHLSNDIANASVDFVATQVTVPRWSGALSMEWSTNTLAAPKNWVLDSDGVTPLDYVDGENVKFEDGAVNPAVNLNVASVSPLSILFSNSVQNYTLSGVYGITGPGSVTKQGSGKVTLATTNSYTGSTMILAGTVSLGTAGAIPGGTGKGSVTLNGTLDIGGFSPTINNLSGSGRVDDLVAGGSPLLTVNDTISPIFSGAIKNTTGTLGLTLAGSGNLTLTGNSTYNGPTVVGSGTLTVNGSLGNTAVTVQNGAALGGTGSIGGPAVMASGTALNLTANTPLTVGALALNGNVSVNVSGTVSVTSTATYVLLNHGAKTGTGSYLLAPVAGIINSGYTATLNDTNNQLLLVIAPTQPTGTIADVKHVIIFMQENRSFDHYFGSLHGVHGFSDHVTLTLTNGNSDLYQPSGSSYELPFHSTIQCLSDLAHDWSSTHQALNSGNWNQWVAAKGTETMAYYNRSDLSYYYSLADNFTICDEYHCGVLSSTDPNRVSLMTGSIDPDDQGGGPLIDNTEPANGWGTNWVTYPELLQKAGVSWKVYQASDNYDDNALNWFAAYKDAAVGTPLYNDGETFAPSVASGSSFLADYTNLVTEFQTAVSNNTLPSVSWIIGPDVGSEHPSWSPEDGEILTKGLLDALASNPKVYNSTVFILNYDENDGFFDHAVPINPPTGTTNEFVSGLPIGLGVRVPCIIISPWTRGGYVCSQVFDHSSVIRFLEDWTGVQEPNISAWRRQVCGDLTSAFDFTHPNTNYPATLAVATENDCSSGSTASPPSPQVVPTQESGTLLERPLPYQPNVLPALNCGAGTLSLILTNAGSASVHFSVYANAYATALPTPYDVNPTNFATASYSTATTSGKYDFSCYGPNGFLRRFAGNLNSDCGQIEAVSYLNPAAGSLAITLANPSATAVVFSVTNGYFANSLATYPVPAFTTNVVYVNASTNNNWYDITATASSDALFVRRFAGHIETNNAVPGELVSSENASGFKDNVTFTATVAGYGTPTGTVQFTTNGIAFGGPIALNNGTASLSTTLLPRGNNQVAASYSGDAVNPAVTYNLTQVVTNHPPVANPVYLVRGPNVSELIKISNLLTNATDVDGDALSLAGVGTDGLNGLSTNGTTLLNNGTFVLYTNSVTPNVNDSFNYTVSDGQGGFNMNTIFLILSNNIVGQSNVKLNISNTNVVASFFGIPGFRYSVDRSTNLMLGAGWVPISTNVAPTNGLIQIIDNFQDLGIPIPPVPSPAFYRLQYNP